MTSVTCKLTEDSLKSLHNSNLSSQREIVMQITRQADYALRAVIYLSKLGPEERAATAQIAQEQQIPPSFLAKIVSQLSVAGLLQTSRGARGGVSLARNPGDITLLDVVEAIDGPILLNECVGCGGVCSFGESCPMKPVWHDTQAQLVAHLKGVTFDSFTRAN
jgi:Rrf2 family protein